MASVELSAKEVGLDGIKRWRELYRHEMNCQVIFDSLHSRPGWTQSYVLSVNGMVAGYGSIAIGGPWTERPTIFEFYLFPYYRSRMFDLFSTLRTVSGAERIETQTNGVMLPEMLHTFARDVSSESILFEDSLMTAHPAPTGAIFRQPTPDDAAQIAEQQLDENPGWLIAVDGMVAATGGVLFHYNPPYGDINMNVAKTFRQQGIATY